MTDKYYFVSEFDGLIHKDTKQFATLKEARNEAEEWEETFSSYIAIIFNSKTPSKPIQARSRFLMKRLSLLERAKKEENYDITKKENDSAILQ